MKNANLERIEDWETAAKSLDIVARLQNLRTRWVNGERTLAIVMQFEHLVRDMRALVGHDAFTGVGNADTP